MAEPSTTATPADATPTPVTTEATNVEQIIGKTKNDPRFVRGVALLKEKRYEEAVAIFEDMLRTMIEVEQESESLAVAPVYYEYGHALLSLAEATASVFGNAGQEEGDVEEEAKETADDLQVAWEMLEIARVIYTRFPEELAVEKELARVYMRLGDLSMESENFEQAKSDYEKSLMLRKKILKATVDPDTTLLADLYCCLAISCIYQDATANGTEQAPTNKIQATLSREEQGLQYYVLAGRVMAENIHRVVAACPSQLLDFVQQRIPTISSSEDVDTTATSKGKGKQKASSTAMDLEYKMNNMTSLREDFLTCAQVYKTLAGENADSTAATEAALTKDEAQLLEYLEIYVELKEKVDGIKESAAAEIVGFGSGAKASEPEAGVTTIGFGAPSTTSTATAPATVRAASTEPAVNVLPVVKKRKITPQTAVASADEQK